MYRVLVTDAEQRSSLAVVRALGRAGYHIEVCSTRDAPLAGASRYSAATHRVRDPRQDVTAFVSDLEDIVQKRGVDVLLPMTDITAASALTIRERRPELVIPFPPLETWQQASDKQRLVQVARDLGVPTPRQHVVANPDADVSAAADFARQVGFPVILKPHRSAVVTPSRVMTFGVRAVSDPQALAEAVADLPVEAFPVMVQERIQGPGLGGFFLADEGRVLHSFAHRRLREKPPTGGVSVLREGIPIRDDIARHSAALLEHFRWSGVAMVEFKEDAQTGVPYLMEINGRFWGSLQLAIDSGVDFPRALLASFLGEHALGSGSTPAVPGRSKSARDGVQTRWLWGDVDHLLWMLRAPKGYRDDHPELPSRVGAVARFLIPWRPSLRYEVLRLTDLRPFLRESGQWLANVLRR